MYLDQDLLFNLESSDSEIEEQLKIFLDQGGNGRDLVAMIVTSPRRGIAKQTSRILNILSGIMDKIGNEMKDEIENL